MKKKCQCIKKDKTCNCSGTLDLGQLNNDQYIEDNLDEIETLYNIMQSISQSLKNMAGRDFELCIKK